MVPTQFSLFFHHQIFQRRKIINSNTYHIPITMSDTVLSNLHELIHLPIQLCKVVLESSTHFLDDETEVGTINSPILRKLLLFLDFLLLHSSPLQSKGHLFWGLVLKGLVGLHRTIKLQLLQCYWFGHRLGLL